MRARISPQRRVGSAPNLNRPVPTSDGKRGACRLLRATSGKGRYFAGLEKTPQSLPVYARRRAAAFDTPVPRNAHNAFKVTTFSGTVEMASVIRVTLYVDWGTDYPGEYVTARAPLEFRTGFASNRCLLSVPPRCEL